MTSRHHRVLRVAPLYFLCCHAWLLGPGLGPTIGAENGDRIVRDEWQVPGPIAGTVLHTRVYRPATKGPLSLVVINHGSTSDAQARVRADTLRFDNIAMWFARRNHLVILPLRMGHGRTGGPYQEDYGACDAPDYIGGGLGAASSVAAAVQYARARAPLTRDPPILVGHSAGAWASLAFASRMGQPVKAVINFSGGLGGRSYGLPNRNCSPERLVEAAAAFGKTGAYPSLWLYADNDTFFGPELSKSMMQAYRSAGGIVAYHLLPAFSNEGHFLLLDSASTQLWAPILEKFLNDLGADRAGAPGGRRMLPNGRLRSGGPPA